MPSSRAFSFILSTKTTLGQPTASASVRIALFEEATNAEPHKSSKVYVSPAYICVSSMSSEITVATAPQSGLFSKITNALINFVILASERLTYSFFPNKTAPVLWSLTIIACAVNLSADNISLFNFGSCGGGVAGGLTTSLSPPATFRKAFWAGPLTSLTKLVLVNKKNPPLAINTPTATIPRHLSDALLAGSKKFGCIEYRHFIIYFIAMQITMLEAGEHQNPP